MKKNSTPSSHWESEDRCPSCGEPCDVSKDLDDKDYCNICRPVKKLPKKKLKNVKK
jgi:hypothetical protein